MTSLNSLSFITALCKNGLNGTHKMKKEEMKIQKRYIVLIIVSSENSIYRGLIFSRPFQDKIHDFK